MYLFQVGCLCPRDTVCEVDIAYPEHPDGTGDSSETVSEFVTEHVLWLGVGTSVMGLLVFYILVIVFLIIKRRKAKQLASSESLRPHDATIDTFIHEERTRSSISPSSPSSSTNSESLFILPQPIISVSQLLAIHQNQNQGEHSLSEAAPSSLRQSPPRPAETHNVLTVHESPLLSSIHQLSQLSQQSSSGSLSSCSISITFSDDTEDSDTSDNSYDHLDHHRSINDIAPNYCH